MKALRDKVVGFFTAVKQLCCRHENQMYAVELAKQRLYIKCPDCGFESPGITLTR